MSHKCVPTWTLLHVSVRHTFISLTSYMGIKDSKKMLYEASLITESSSFFQSVNIRCTASLYSHFFPMMDARAASWKGDKDMLFVWHDASCLTWRIMSQRKHIPKLHIFKMFISSFNPLKPELNPICYLLALLGAHRFLHVSRIRVKLLTLRWLMSYIYGAPILDVSRSHTTTQHSR